MAQLRKPAGLVDREMQWKELAALWHSPRPELVFVLGRRRVGKSFVLGPLARDLHKLRERAQLTLKELGAVTSVKYVLFSRHAPVDRALREEIAGGRVIWLGLDDLLPNK